MLHAHDIFILYGRYYVKLCFCRILQKRGFNNEFFQKLKEINSPVKSNSPAEEEIVEVNVVKKEIITLRPKLVRIKTSRGDKLL